MLILNGLHFIQLSRLHCTPRDIRDLCDLIFSSSHIHSCWVRQIFLRLPGKNLKHLFFSLPLRILLENWLCWFFLLLLMMLCNIFFFRNQSSSVYGFLWLFRSQYKWNAENESTQKMCSGAKKHSHLPQAELFFSSMGNYFNGHFHFLETCLTFYIKSFVWNHLTWTLSF